jgi:poly(A) polymerase
MAPRLDPAQHAWMRDPATLAVMAALEAARPGSARYVGGAVRNALTGHPVHDVDIATSLTPDSVTAALQAAGIKAVPTGVDHGTITAVADHRPFEITTLRHDVQTDGRRAVVAFTESWEEDAARRDFRLNALYADPDGTIHDFHGGAADALAGRIVFIGEPRDRIEEDYLRILRFYRFHAWYGRGPLDAQGQAACSALKGGISQLSAERVWAELKKLLSARDPSQALSAMSEAGVLAAILPAPADPALALAAIPLTADPLLRAAALIGADPEAAAALSDAMKVSKAERARLESACAAPLAPGLPGWALRAAVWRDRAEAASDRLVLGAAAGRGEADALDADLAAIRAWQAPAFPLKAADLIAAGYERGPRLGETLRRLEDDWIASDFTLDREALLSRA